MAKSPLLGKMKHRAVASENVVRLPSMTLIVKNGRKRSTIDFTTLKHLNKDISKPKPILNRDKDINKLALYFHGLNDKGIFGRSRSAYDQLTPLLTASDDAGVYPFSKQGVVALSRHLWMNVQAYSSLKQAWEYADGELLGYKETMASSVMNTNLKLISDALGHKNPRRWLSKEKAFSSQGGRESYEAYDEKELMTLVRRLTLYFTQLATQLIEFKRTGDIEQQIKVSVDGVDWLVPVTAEVSYKGGLASEKLAESAVLTSLAFNQAMSSAFYILSYFTAFNTSSSLDVRRPLTVTKSKTEEWYQLDAFKGRSHSNIEALLGGRAHKKALTFIQLLVSLSEAYNPGEHGLLLYTITRANTPTPLLDSNLTTAKIPEVLDLTVSKKNQCIDHLCRVYAKLINSYQSKDYSYSVYRIRNNRVLIQTEQSKSAIANRISTLAFAILDAINLESINLSGIVLPVGIEEQGETVKLSFRYVNGELGSMTIPLKYMWVVEKQLEFAISRIRLLVESTRLDYARVPLGLQYFNSPLAGYNPMYLIPFGTAKSGFKQWNGLSPSLSPTLNDFGVRVGNYRLDLNASRLRETNGTVVRTRKGSTVNNVATILQNMTDTVLQHYGEDNKHQNLIIMSHGIHVVEEIITDKSNQSGITKESLERAKQLVREKLNQPVLAYDQYLNLGRQQNGIGMHCSSPYDPDKTRKAKREADKANLLNKGEVLACHEYLDCVGCPHSKLIDDVDALYRLLSFINLLEEFRIYHLTEEHYQRNFGAAATFLQELVTAKLPKITINKAQMKLDRQGRHIAWNDIALVQQFLN
jgi:hypothetical protein